MLKKTLYLLFGLFLFFPSFSSATPKYIIILDPGHGGKDQGGYSGRGFLLNGEYVPEDGYTYDIAKRVAWLLQYKNWLVVFTVVDKKNDRVFDYNAEKIIPARREMTYNLTNDNTIVFSGRNGLQKRLDAATRLHTQYPHAQFCFISLHIDYASPVVSGTKIYTPHHMSAALFVKILVENFTENELGFTVRNQRKPMINQINNFFILKNGSIVPRVLIELGNFNNLDDQTRILESQGREEYAKIIAASLEEFFFATHTQ